MKSTMTLVVFLLFMLTACGEDAAPAWQIQGCVVDEHGIPVEDFEAAAEWSSNGVYWNEDGSYVKGRELQYKQEGVLATKPRDQAQRLPGGKFVQSVEGDAPCRSVFALDRANNRGGFITVDKTECEKPVTIKLLPLKRVTGKVYCPETKRTPDWTCVVVHPVGDETNYLQFTTCGSVKGTFSLLLPPGSYDFLVLSDGPRAHMLKPMERRTRDAPADMPRYLAGIRVQVPKELAALDLGVLDVVPINSESHAYFAKFYGEQPPELSITDARGVPKSVQLADYRGKWVLLDFWTLSCGPCIKDVLPKLAKFYEEHAADRDHFEILSVCNTSDRDAKTIDQFDPIVAPLVEKFWAGKPLPFPLLLDGNGKTFDDYGVDGVPMMLLIDPDGNVIKGGGPTMLAAKLKQPKP